MDRLVDGDLLAVLTEVKTQAQAGDPSAISILGEIAHQQCYLGRSPEALDQYAAAQLANAQALPSTDAEWFRTSLQEDVEYDKRIQSVCKQLIDVDQALSWVDARARQGDGASLWLMSMSGNNLAEMQRRLRDAAAAGFPEAQFELAWAIIAGQRGAAGIGSDAVNAGDLLRQSAERLPRAEAELAMCEYSGCPGIALDLDSAITHAREASQRGSIDALISLGPHLSAGQMDPNEVSAWNLVHAALEQQGCVGNGFSVKSIKAVTSTLMSPNITANARTLADQYWQDYGAQIMTNLGCSP